MSDLDEPIHLVAYDPEWPHRYASERARVASALASVAPAIEHIGSTAVPGALAKPIVDIMVGLRTFPPPPALTNPLLALGYEGLGEANVPGRLYFRRRGESSFNVHVVEHEGAHWRSNLVLRDYLRAHPAEAASYSAAKAAIEASGARTLLAYSEAKAPLVQELLERALAWRATG